MENTCVASDFTYDAEESFFVHDATDFRLDSDFVLLFDNDMVMKVFHGSTGYHLSPETLKDMREIVLEHTESIEEQ